MSLSKPNPNPWLICIVAALSFFFAFMQMNLFNGINEILLNRYAISNGDLGFLSYAYFLGLAIAFLPIGMLFEAFSTKKIMLSGMAIAIILILIFAFNHGFFLAFLIRFLLGAMQAIAILGALRICSKWLSHYLAIAMGMVFTIGLLGGIVAQAPFAFLLKTTGFNHAFLVDGLVGVVIFILMWLFIQDPYLNAKHTNDKKHLTLKKFMTIFTDRQDWIYAIYACCLNLPALVLGAVWGVLFFTHSYHISTSQSLTAVSFMFFGLVFGSTVFGVVSDKLKTRKIPMIIAAIISCVITIVVLLNHSYALLILLLFLLGIIMGAQTLSYALVVENSDPNLESVATSFISIIIMGVGAISQPIYAVILRHSNNSIAYSILIAGAIVSLILSLFIKEKH